MDTLTSSDIYTVKPNEDKPYIFNIHNKKKYEISVNYVYIILVILIILFLLLIILLFFKPLNLKSPTNMVHKQLKLKINNTSGILKRNNKIKIHHITDKNNIIIFKKNMFKSTYKYNIKSDSIALIKYNVEKFNIKNGLGNFSYKNLELLLYVDFHYGKFCLSMVSENNNNMSISFGKLKMKKKNIN